MNKIYVVANVVFLPIDTDKNNSPKYLRTSVHGNITSLNVWGKDEILMMYPNAKECNNLLELKAVWEKN